MIKLEGGEEKTDAPRAFSFLDKTLFERRTLTLFGEIDMDVAQRTDLRHGRRASSRRVGHRQARRH